MNHVFVCSPGSRDCRSTRKVAASVAERLLACWTPRCVLDAVVSKAWSCGFRSLGELLGTELEKTTAEVRPERDDSACALRVGGKPKASMA